MACCLEAVVEATGETEDEILRKGDESYVERELREARIRVARLRDEYGVETPSALEMQIEDEAVDEHPAWEDLIERENPTTRIERLERL